MAKQVKSVILHIILRVSELKMVLIRKFCILFSYGVLLVIVGCQTLPKPEEFFHPVSLKERQMQTRIYLSNDDVHILKVCTDLLLDNKFQIREAESRLGWIDASKLKVAHNLHFSASVYVSVVTRPVQGRSGAIAVRVIFHQVKPGQGVIMVKNLAIYQEFFADLSKALFLEAHQI